MDRTTLSEREKSYQELAPQDRVIMVMTHVKDGRPSSKGSASHL